MISNPYNFRLYDLENFAMYVNGRQIPPEGVNLLMGNEKAAVMGYRTLFEGSGIHHSNSGLQITPDKYTNGLTIQNTNVMHLILFIRQIFSSTCFEYQVLIFRRIQLYVSSIWYRHSL